MMNKEKRKKYYLKEFKKIDDGKITWNWSSCLFLPYWLIYRKIYSGIWKLAILLICTILFCVALAEIIPQNIVFLLGVLMLLIAGGTLGNRWYYSTVKYRIQKGYHLYKEYKPTTVPLLLIQVLCPIADKLTTASNVSAQHFILFRLLGIIILIVYWYKDKRAVKRIIGNTKHFQNDVNESNISHLI